MARTRPFPKSFLGCGMTNVFPRNRVLKSMMGPRHPHELPSLSFQASNDVAAVGKRICDSAPDDLFLFLRRLFGSSCRGRRGRLGVRDLACGHDLDLQIDRRARAGLFDELLFAEPER